MNEKICFTVKYFAVKIGKKLKSERLILEFGIK
jgi:hypothetical protein